MCLNRICTKEIQCSSNADCDNDKECQLGKNGILQCLNVCERAPCGRHAYCNAKDHQASCLCNDGYFGDPMQGCKKKECDTHTECTDDKVCDQNTCKIACLIRNDCGENSICSSEKHTQICYCQPGYTGDPIKGCTAVDWCASAPCGNGAECKSARDRAHCTCPSGTVGNPYEEGCRKAQECRFNRDCPAVARCTVVDGISKCTGKISLYFILSLNVSMYE